jgi:hypothetical protein
MASPTWKAIEHGLELFKKGIISRVGSSTKIQIWRDPWIPRPTSMKLSLKKGRSWVLQLMQPRRGEWDTQIIHTCLYPHDAEEVLKICLSQRVIEDYIAWQYEKEYFYSAYMLALQSEQQDMW